MAIRSSSPEDYKVVSAIITSDRLGSFEFDVVSSIVDMSFSEALDALSCSGQITLVDDANLLAVIDFQGTEYITFEMGLPDEVQPLLKRTFVINELMNSQKANDQSEVLMFSLDSIDSYINALTNVNKVYDGTPAEIIQKIAKDSFGLKKIVLTNDTLFQGPMRVIIPNWTPFVAMKWLADRCTSALGTPYFIWSSLGDENIRLLDLQSLLEGVPMNANQPYRYNQGSAQNMSEQNPTLQAYNIKRFTVENTENTVDIAYDGGISGEYRFLDTTTFQDNKYQYDVNNVYRQLADKSNLFTKGATPNYDTEFKINDKNIHSYNTTRATQIATSKVYNDMPSYHEAVTPEAHAQKATSLSLREFMYKSAMEIIIPGYNMYYSGSKNYSNVSVGNLISLEFLDNDPKQAGANISDNTPDGKRSGVYLIEACRHMIKNDQGKFKYECVLKILKIANRDGMTQVPV